jgi:copper chaperone CopZ
MNTLLKIAKLTSATDTAHIEKTLEAIPRVNSVTVEPDENQALIEHEGADEQELASALKQLGYIATVEKSPFDQREKSP